jgi:hypothetical protein
MAGYGNDTDFASWLAGAGHALPPSAPTPAVLRQRGSDYLDAAYGPRLLCSTPTGGLDQERAWPRTGHTVNGQAVAADAIPAAWVRASYRAAWLEASKPGSLSATVRPDQRVRRQKADVIEREFFDSGEVKAGGGGMAVIDAEIDGMVAPFLCPLRSALLLVV